MAVQGGSRNIMRRNNVVVLGTGQQTLVLAHGLGCDQRIWHKVVPMLAADYRLVLFDYVGAGESDLQQYNVAKYKTLRGYAEDLLDVVECLNLKRPYLLSHSASGSIGALAEDAAPGTFERLVMISPSPRYINEGDYHGGFDKADIDGLIELMEENYFQWADVMASSAMKNEERPELKARLVRSFQQARPDIMLNFARAILYSDYRREYEQLKCPVSVLETADDSIVPRSVTEYLANAIADCQVQRIDGQGHYPQLSHAAEVVALVRRILSADRQPLEIGRT